MYQSNNYLEYFYSRGLDTSTIKTFDLGFYTKDGVVSNPSFTTFLDYRFKDCVLFPIYDLYSNLISVSGRTLQDRKEMKYVHTTYPKRKHLYGLNVTYKNILNSREVYIVEGNFDLLTLYKNGVTNSVAMLGSSLTLDQFSLLRRFADTLILAADGDKAGFECADRFVKDAQAYDVPHRIIRLPYKKDPDNFIKESGIENFLKLDRKGIFHGN